MHEAYGFVSFSSVLRKDLSEHSGRLGTHYMGQAVHGFLILLPDSQRLGLQACSTMLSCNFNLSVKR